MQEIRIKSEEEAWAAMAKALAQDRLDDIDFLFDGWPKLQLTIKGKDFQGTIPTRIMPPILDLQKEIHRTYCLLRYGTDNLRKLTADDRVRLEIVVKIDEGSSVFSADIWKELNETVKAAMKDMDSKHKLIVVISLALSVAAPLSWKFWLNSQERMKDLDASVQLEQIENERIALLTKAKRAIPEVGVVTSGVDDFRNHALHRLHDEDRLEILHDEKPAFVIDGVRAAEVTEKPREESIEIRIDGEFLIEEVRSGGIRGFKIKVRRVLDGKEIVVSIPDGTLTEDQVDVLKNNEWAKKSVVMEINAKELRGKIISAVLVKTAAIQRNAN